MSHQRRRDGTRRVTILDLISYYYLNLVKTTGRSLIKSALAHLIKQRVSPLIIDPAESGCLSQSDFLSLPNVLMYIVLYSQLLNRRPEVAGHQKRD